MEAVILAGGLGTRLGSLAADRPKALVPVCGTPFASLQLEWLARQGVDRVTYSIGHLGDQIVAYVGDGGRWGLRVDYVDESDRLRGTAGALRLAFDRNQLPARFFVLYGDSFLQIDLAALWQEHVRSEFPATMSVFQNDGVYEDSNVVFEEGTLVRYDKSRPPEWAPRMKHIDYGVSVMEREIIETDVDSDRPADLATLQRDLSAAGRMGGFEVFERFYEVGTPDGLAQLEAHLAKQPPLDDAATASATEDIDRTEEST